VKTSNHLQNISNSSLSPLPSLFLSSTQNSFLSLTHRRCWYAGKSRLLSGGERPSPHRKALSFQVLSHSLSILRYLTLSLTSPLSSHRFCSTPENRPPRWCRKDQPFTSSENPQTRRYLLSLSLTLSLTSPTHCVTADRHLQR
jgi:hypothetical protein